MQQCASECACPRRQIFDIHAAKPFHQHVGIAEVGAPPEIEVLTGDRQWVSQAGTATPLSRRRLSARTKASLPCAS